VTYLGATRRWAFGVDPPDPDDTSLVQGHFSAGMLFREPV
jgi:hypothetical protein